MLSVSLNDYALSGLSGFGESTQGDVDQLMKALEAGAMTGGDLRDTGSTQSGAVLKVESLENTLRVMSFHENDIVLWKQIPKSPAFNTVEEYDLLEDYGTDGFSFTLEGELPEEDQATYRRASQLVKFMGTVGSVSHPMQLVNVISGIGNITQQKIEESTMKLLRDINRAVAWADSNLLPIEFNGLYAQHRQGLMVPGNLSSYYGGNNVNVIDCRGKAMKDSFVQDGTLAIVEANGNATDLIAPPAVWKNYVSRWDNSDVQRTTPGATITGGQVIDGIATQYGKINPVTDKFLAHKYKPKTALTNATSGKTPAAPASVSVAAVASVGMYSGFNGDYKFAVTAMNRYGESVITQSASVTIGANESADITLTLQGGTYAAQAYNIYKGEVNKVTGTVTYYYLFSVTPAQISAGYDGAAAGVIRERNYIIPNTNMCFLLEKTKEIFNFKQLAPLMKMDLALIAPSSRFMLLAYGTPVLNQPKKMIVYINVGSSVS